MKVRFLRLEEVIALHSEQIALYGGAEGIRDLGLLESAVATAEATFGGSFLHVTLPEMAAAYHFHLAQNHPFLDGNKRIAAAALYVFLAMNDIELDCTEDELVELTLAVANGTMTKAEVSVFVAAHVSSTHSTRP